MASPLPRCAACQSHVRADERRCPFCGATLVAAGRPSARIVAAAALVGVATACSVYGPCGDCGSGDPFLDTDDSAVHSDVAALPDAVSATGDTADLALDGTAVDAAGPATATDTGEERADQDTSSR